MSFDTLAPFYRSMEFVLAGSLLQRCRTSFLPEVQKANCALLLGEGPGKYLTALLEINPGVRVTCVDASARMLTAARASILAKHFEHREVQFICSDWRSWNWDQQPFDMVATHFFLDCFIEQDLPLLISKVASTLRPAATWVLSEFHEPRAGWRKMRARLVLKLAYRFFRQTTGISASHLPRYHSYFQAAGFRLIAANFLNHGLLEANIWESNRYNQS